MAAEKSRVSQTGHRALAPSPWEKAMVSGMAEASKDAGNVYIRRGRSMMLYGLEELRRGDMEEARSALTTAKALLKESSNDDRMYPSSELAQAVVDLLGIIRGKKGIDMDMDHKVRGVLSGAVEAGEGALPSK